MKRYRLVVLLVGGLLCIGSALGIATMSEHQTGASPWDQQAERTP